MITEVKQYKTTNGTLFDNKEFAETYERITTQLPFRNWNVNGDYLIADMRSTDIEKHFNLKSFVYNAAISVDLQSLEVIIDFEDYHNNPTWTFADVKEYENANLHWETDLDHLWLAFNLKDLQAEPNAFKTVLTTAFKLAAKHLANN